MGDNKACEIVGKGDILLSIEGGAQFLLQDVRHVPKLKRILIFVSQLYAQGFLTLLTDTWKITKGSMIIAKGNKVGNLYVVETNDEVGAAMTIADSNAALWHQRLGHMRKKGLEVMLNCDQLLGLQLADLEFCEHFLHGKQKCVIFLKHGHDKKTTPLELVPSNVFSLTEVTSHGGENLFVSFLDDCTRKVWVYMMSRKSEVFSKFKIFKALVENQSRHKIKCLKLDNGGEFCSLEFDKFCVDQGI